MWTNEEIEKLYEAIPHRKSVRKYEERPLTDDTINQVQEALDKVKIFFPEAPVAAQILDNGAVKGKFTTKCASYIAVYANREPKAYANAGSILEQMHLWLSSQNIGSWIHGLAAPVKPYDTKGRLPFAFILTFGNAAEPVHRNGPDEFNRNDAASFTDNPELEIYAQTMLLAPSGRNRQPWLIKGDPEAIHIFTIKDHMLFAKIMPDLWVMEGGIAATHLWLEADRQGKAFNIVYDETVKPASSKEVYGCTISLK